MKRSACSVHNHPSATPARPRAGLFYGSNMKPIETCDAEWYINYFLVKWYNPSTKIFEKFELRGKFTCFSAEQIAAIKNKLMDVTSVTFYGKKADWPMLALALAGMCCRDMKEIGNTIFNEKMQPWQVEKTYNVKTPHEALCDHIDIIEVAPGTGSLKIYSGRVHSRFMQDLPIAHDKELTPDEMDVIDKYNDNDLLCTADLYAKLEDDIATRADLTAQYGVDMRSRSDAQIAEEAFKKLLGWRWADCNAAKEAAYVRPGTQFYYTPPPFITFRGKPMQDALALIVRSPFTIAANGSPMMTEEMRECLVTIGDMAYQFGAGGLHSTEHRARHVADDEYSLRDVDADSFYPKIISNLRMFPKQIGEVFLTIFEDWIEQRLAYKRNGQKKKSATFKIKINGTFGKLGSAFSILYAPQLLIQTTVTGQLCLAMLIERLESVDGISVVSANTDGVVIKCKRTLHMVRDAIVARWQKDCGFTTEASDYLALFSRDVNSYLAVKDAYTDEKGVYHELEFKTKNAFADPGLQKNPTGSVCVDAVKAYLVGGTPIEQTIRRCGDIRKFVHVRGITTDKAGGWWVKDTLSATTIKGRAAELVARGWIDTGEGRIDENDPPLGDTAGWAVPLTSAHEAARQAVERVYLGKAVRWYYGRGQRGHIAMGTSGNMVATSEGCKPCMELPRVLPPDIDYERYIADAREMLRDIACA
jgi:hypothetical protein